MTRLSRRFFARPTLQVARDLLGQRLVRLYEGERLGGIICECEAYIGEADTACHASHGRTARTQVMYGEPGRAYVYFTYGIHWMLNCVTERVDFPAAVLIRAVVPDEGIETMRELRGRKPEADRLRGLADGPAKLCQALAVDGALNAEDLVTSERLFIERQKVVPEARVRQTPRIGIENADRVARDHLWRFVLLPDTAQRGTHNAQRV
ncbi:MAG: DNA-3-methyladenine glycosylase [Chloroflexi bacterium]|nr:DNA-3-methyladenine glycosylase [Chloroflexota bacterium]